MLKHLLVKVSPNLVNNTDVISFGAKSLPFATMMYVIMYSCGSDVSSYLGMSGILNIFGINSEATLGLNGNFIYFFESGTLKIKYAIGI